MADPKVGTAYRTVGDAFRDTFSPEGREAWEAVALELEAADPFATRPR